MVLSFNRHAIQSIAYMKQCCVYGTVILPNWPSSSFWPIFCPNGNYMYVYAVKDVIVLPNSSKEVGSRRIKIGLIKWAKLNWSFDKLFSAWTTGHIWWFMKMIIFFKFFAIVPEIPVPNITKSNNLLKITIFLLWKLTKCLFFATSTALLH
jgi:hypothetical protein